MAVARDGERLVAAVPQRHGQTTTLIAALKQSGIVAPLVRDGPNHRSALGAYAAQFLRRRSSPVTSWLYNLAAHKGAGVRQAITPAGAVPLYLSPYAPDLKPIEQLFAKLRAILRSTAARIKDALWQAIGRLCVTAMISFDVSVL